MQTPLQTPVCEMLGIRFPILLAGMGNSASVPELAAAVSNAGGLGVLGCVGMEPERLREWIRRTKDLTDRPFGVDTALPSNVPSSGEEVKMDRGIGDEHQQFARDFALRHEIEIPERTAAVRQSWNRDLFRRQLDVIMEERVPVYAAGLGNPGPFMDEFRQCGIKVLALVGNVKQATRVAAAGVDLVVAQGHEGGGHTGRVATFPLIPMVVDAVAPTPVLAAGGIGDGRGIVAALALGAQGVWVGTAFLMAEECGIPIEQKRRLAEANDEATVVTNSISGKPLRTLVNSWSLEFDASGLRSLPMPFQSMISGPIQEAALKQHKFEVTMQSAGQVAGLGTKVRPAREILDEMMVEAEAIIHKWCD